MMDIAREGNSPLVSYVRLSPNFSKRTREIDTITIHHMAGNFSVESCCGGFANPSRGASSNYCIGSDGRIGLSVEEDKRSWCSSNPANDDRAVTIEVANCGGAPDWPVSEAAYAALIELCVDICRRNGIRELRYTGDVKGNLTRHNMFAATACPGPYLQARFPQIAEEVNRRLAEPEAEGMSGKEIYEKLYAYLSEQPIPKWAQAEFQEAMNLGITDGSAPMALIPRYQAALMAKRAAEAALRRMEGDDRK